MSSTPNSAKTLGDRRHFILAAKAEKYGIFIKSL